MGISSAGGTDAAKLWDAEEDQVRINDDSANANKVFRAVLGPQAGLGADGALWPLDAEATCAIAVGMARREESPLAGLVRVGYLQRGVIRPIVARRGLVAP